MSSVQRELTLWMYSRSEVKLWAEWWLRVWRSYDTSGNFNILRWRNVSASTLLRMGVQWNFSQVSPRGYPCSSSVHMTGVRPKAWVEAPDLFLLQHVTGAWPEERVTYLKVVIDVGEEAPGSRTKWYLLKGLIPVEQEYYLISRNPSLKKKAIIVMIIFIIVFKFP